MRLLLKATFYFAWSVHIEFLKIGDIHCQILGFIWQVVDLQPLMFQWICYLDWNVSVFKIKGLS